jgi:hypothetical protein
MGSLKVLKIRAQCRSVLHIKLFGGKDLDRAKNGVRLIRGRAGYEEETAGKSYMG